jgi:hypothetical protein
MISVMAQLLKSYLKGLNGRMIMNIELEGTGVHVVLAYLNVPYRYSPRRNREKNK